MSGDNNDILAKVEEYMLDDNDFSNDFEEFAAKNCEIFEDTEENKLQYMDIYNNFTNLFNQRIEGFITKNGSTLEDFVKACEEAEEGNFAVQLIMSITSFDAFKQLMLEQKAKSKTNVQ